MVIGVEIQVEVSNKVINPNHLVRKCHSLGKLEIAFPPDLETRTRVGTGANQGSIFHILRSVSIDWQTSLVGQKPRLCDVMPR